MGLACGGHSDGLEEGRGILGAGSAPRKFF